MNTIKLNFDNLGFYLKEVTDENGDTWIIEGYCSRCGQCCINPIYNPGYNDENGRCTHLKYETLNGKVNYVCKIYEHRPVCCAIWPRELQDLIENDQCTYKMVKKIT